MVWSVREGESTWEADCLAHNVGGVKVRGEGGRGGGTDRLG